MDFANYFPIWNQLTPTQRDQLSSISEFRHVRQGTVLHNGNMDCLGLLLIRSGQLRVYMLSPDGTTTHERFVTNIRYTIRY